MCASHAGLQRDSGIFRGADHRVDLKRLAGAALWTSANCWPVSEVTPNTATEQRRDPCHHTQNRFFSWNVTSSHSATFWVANQSVVFRCSSWSRGYLAYCRGQPALVPLFGKIQSRGIDRWVLCYISGLCCQQLGSQPMSKKLTEAWETENICTKNIFKKIMFENITWLLTVQRLSMTCRLLPLKSLNRQAVSNMLLLCDELNNSSGYFSSPCAFWRQNEIWCDADQMNHIPKRGVSISCICSLAASPKLASSLVYLTVKMMDLMASELFEIKRKLNKPRLELQWLIDWKRSSCQLF